MSPVPMIAKLLRMSASAATTQPRLILGVHRTTVQPQMLSYALVLIDCAAALGFGNRDPLTKFNVNESEAWS